MNTGSMPGTPWDQAATLVPRLSVRCELLTCLAAWENLFN